jgi:hypothetical protein
MNTASNISPPPSKTRSRVVLLLLALCFMAPILTALLLQSPLLRYQAEPTRNFGELLQPVVPISVAALVTTQIAADAKVEAQWTLLFIAPAQCGNCAAQLDLLAHIRQATGRELDRVKLEVISAQNLNLPAQAGFTVRTGTPAQLQNLTQQLGLNQGGLVIVDPLRNAMMRYPSDFDGSKVRKDLARLLKASQVGKSQSSGVIS